MRLYHAFEAYDRSYSIEVHPGQVLNLLTTDPLIPDSLCRSLDRTASDLASIGPGPNTRAGGALSRLAGRMTALIHYDWPDSEDRPELLRQVSQYCRELHNLVTAAYFEYSVDDFPGTLALWAIRPSTKSSISLVTCTLHR